MSLRNTIGSADLEATDLAFAQNAIAGLRADAEYFTHFFVNPNGFSKQKQGDRKNLFYEG